MANFIQINEEGKIHSFLTGGAELGALPNTHEVETLDLQFLGGKLINGKMTPRPPEEEVVQEDQLPPVKSQ